MVLAGASSLLSICRFLVLLAVMPLRKQPAHAGGNLTLCTLDQLHTRFYQLDLATIGSGKPCFVTVHSQ
ncbi:hypothetical protein NS96R_14265 [Pseudomonas parafulva]|uniref:Uncharacterized protein n=1 Tax=Pseudomonas parafulva TaxID=157782 RepID=A0AAJ0LIR7_9PSED|nr:hypothetical protein NS96R_14265 [Pseudomonas parafulva]